MRLRNVVKAGIVVGIMWASVSAAETTTKCENLANFAGATMLAYQNGMPKSYLMAKVDELDKGPVAVAIVEKAYTFPRRDTATEQTKLAREYLEIWYEICVDALGGD